MWCNEENRCGIMRREQVCCGREEDKDRYIGGVPDRMTDVCVCVFVCKFVLFVYLYVVCKETAVAVN